MNPTDKNAISANPNSPKPYDAVRGGESAPPLYGAVLGGLAGLEKRMAAAPVEIKIACLKDALKYGRDGLNLAIASLNDPLEDVQFAAYCLLRSRTEPAVKNALLNYIPGIYKKIGSLLAAAQWQAGDRATAAALLKLAGREKQGWLRVEDINRIPSSDLHIIDDIWRECSGDRFGFSVQKQIWQQSGNNYWMFGDRVGWRQARAWLNYSQLSFNTIAPVGHLPAAHLTWDALQREQQWLWYAGTPEDTRWFELKSLLARSDLK